MQNEVKEVNESLQKTGLYMVKDKTTGLHSFLYQGLYGDKSACQEIINYFGKIFKSLKKAQKVKFMQSLHNSVFVKVGTLDLVTGELVPDYTFLVDFNEVILKDKEEKNESEKK